MASINDSEGGEKNAKVRGEEAKSKHRKETGTSVRKSEKGMVATWY